MQSLRNFIQEEEGFTGAEKVVVTLIAVGLIIVLGKLILDGSKTAGNTANTQMNQAAAPNMSW